MNREKYIQLRIKNSYVEILYDYAYNRGFNHSLQDFYNYFVAYSQVTGPHIINNYLERVLLYYDIKYNITIISKSEQVKTNDIIGNPVEEVRLKTIKII